MLAETLVKLGELKALEEKAQQIELGLAGKGAILFRFTLKHSIFLTVIVGVIAYLQAYYQHWLIP